MVTAHRNSPGYWGREMKSTVKRALETVYQTLFKIIYGSSSRVSLHPRFDSSPGEAMCRYLTDRDEYSPCKRIVRHSAFIPPENLRKSVYWTSGITEEEIWSIGDEYVAPSRGPLHGRADFNSLAAYREGLAIELTEKPHPRHADIVNWDEDRKKARLQAVKLADQATLVLA